MDTEDLIKKLLYLADAQSDGEDQDFLRRAAERLNYLNRASSTYYNELVELDRKYERITNQLDREQEATPPAPHLS